MKEDNWNTRKNLKLVYSRNLVTKYNAYKLQVMSDLTKREMAISMHPEQSRSLQHQQIQILIYKVGK